jgi:hypothetical protein
MAPMNPMYLIISGTTITALQEAVGPKLRDGVWECQGGPFWNAERAIWCQAIVRTQQAAGKPGEVRLREKR